MVWGKEFKLPEGAKPAPLADYYYQAMREQTSITTIKKILNIWLTWALICSVYH